MSFENLKLREFLEALSSKTPTPGGGTASAAASLIGIATGIMSARFSTGENVDSAISALTNIQLKLAPLLDKDAQSYEEVDKVLKMPKGAPERVKKLQEAIIQAADVPLETAKLSLSALECLLKFAPYCNKNLASDLGVAARLLDAGAQGAALNVKINTKLMKDFAKKSQLDIAIAEICSNSEKIQKEILQKVNL